MNNLVLDMMVTHTDGTRGKVVRLKANKAGWPLINIGNGSLRYWNPANIK